MKLTAIQQALVTLALSFTVGVAHATPTQGNPLGREQKAPSLCTLLLGRGIDAAFMHRDSWEFSEALNSELNAISNNPHLIPALRVKLLFQILMDARIEQLPQSRRAEMQKVLDDTFNPNSEYRVDIANGRQEWITLADELLSHHGNSRAFQSRFLVWFANRLKVLAQRAESPHYSTTSSAVGMTLPSVMGLSHWVVLFHELEHAVDSTSSRTRAFGAMLTQIAEKIFPVPTAIGVPLLYSMESRAMGAQWELVSRIPLEERQQMIVQVERDILELQNEAQFFYFIKYRVLPRIQNRAQGQESDRKPLQVRLGTAAGIQTIIIPGDPVEFERMGRERSWNVVAAFLEQRISRYEGIAYEQEIGMLQVTLQSLRGAGLSKEHFLELQAPVHGYSGAQFVERAFTLTPYRRAGMSAMGLYVLYRLLQEDDDESEAAAGAPPVQAPAALLAH